MIQVRARVLVPGEGRGEAVKVEALSFYGEVDPRTGKLVDGRSITGKVLVVGRPRGSTVGSYTIYGLKYYGRKPAAIIVESGADPILVAGAVLADIPLFDNARNILESVDEGDLIEFNREGVVSIVKQGLL
ncbi:MAG: DUF126 domain-containing protein [Desulfurococcales archaeon]|nr:DUF126 domain-containing protein [Desulfurococcales archaeon]